MGRKIKMVRAPEVNAIQHGGTHYKVQAIQPWDYIVANQIGFLEGNAIKYLTRWKDKGGIEDLLKARHYIDKLIETETNASKVQHKTSDRNSKN
jgi:hypothetical protein